MPDVLTFSSSESDAAITFVNSTTANGVVSQHGRTFDIVASANLLVVRLVHVFSLSAALQPTVWPNFCIHVGKKFLRAHPVSCVRCQMARTAVVMQMKSLELAASDVI